MNRRGFLAAMAAGAVVTAEGLWIPGKKLISIPKMPRRVYVQVIRPVNGEYFAMIHPEMWRQLRGDGQYDDWIRKAGGTQWSAAERVQFADGKTAKLVPNSAAGGVG